MEQGYRVVKGKMELDLIFVDGREMIVKSKEELGPYMIYEGIYSDSLYKEVVYISEKEGFFTQGKNKNQVMADILFEIAKSGKSIEQKLEKIQAQGRVIPMSQNLAAKLLKKRTNNSIWKNRILVPGAGISNKEHFGLKGILSLFA